MKRRAMASKKRIIEYWSTRVDEDELGTDWSDAEGRCWCCGDKSKQDRTERCHIIPHALGGSGDPSNLVLLCKRCHLDSPDVADPNAMWDWIKENSNGFYGLPRGTMATVRKLIANGKIGPHVQPDESSFPSPLNIQEGYRKLEKQMILHAGHVSQGSIEWLFRSVFSAKRAPEPKTPTLTKVN